MAIHVLVISSYRGPRTFRMAMQLVHLVIPFLIILNFPSLKKQVLMQTMQRLMVGTCIAITYYMYIMYAVYYSSVSRNEMCLWNYSFCSQKSRNLMWFGCCLYWKIKRNLTIDFWQVKTVMVQTLRYGLTWKLRIKTKSSRAIFQFKKTLK